MKRDDFERLISDTDLLLQISAIEAREMFCLPISQMIGFDQKNPHHCYDLWRHSIHTLRSLKRDTRMPLKIAAFFHDIGKPYVAFEKKGRLVFYGHAIKSVEVACKLLMDMGYSEIDISEICFYINHHDDFISWVLPDEQYDKKNKFLIEINHNNLKKHIAGISGKDGFQPLDENWRNLLELCWADVSAQSDEVWQGDVLIDTKKHKFAKITLLKRLMQSV